MAPDSFNSTLPEQSGPLSTGKMLAYVLPKIPLFLLLGPITILPGFYAKYFGLSLTTIATILVMARIFDTATDPIIGYFSDWYHVRKGTRKPFVIIGGILLVASSYFLYVPADPDTLALLKPDGSAVTTVNSVYFLFCIFAFYLAMTIFEIPHLAWGSELTANIKDRNKLFGLRFFSGIIGQVMFFAVPLLGIFETNEFTPHTMQWSVMATAIVLIPSLYICITSVPNGGHQVQPRAVLNVNKTLAMLLSNKPFILVIAAFSFFHIAVGMWISLLYIFVDSHLHWGDQLPMAYCLSYSISALSIWAWCRFANQMGKKLTMGIGMLLTFVGTLSTALLSPEVHWLMLVFLMILVYGGVSAAAFVEPSLLADIIDYGTWKFGYSKAAIYFSINGIASKISMAIGGALSLAIASWYGFDPTNSVNSDSAIKGLYLAIAWLPAPFILIALVLITLIPINAHHHTIIRRRLDARQARANPEYSCTQQYPRPPKSNTPARDY